MRFASSRSSRPRLRDLVAALHEDERPIAETWRRVAEAANRLELPAPSYPHARRLVLSERRRRALLARRRAALERAASSVAAGRAPAFDPLVGELIDTSHGLADERACVSETQAGIEQLEAEDERWAEARGVAALELPHERFEGRAR